MSKNNENKLVPKLRFPEFINDGNWGYDSVENLVTTTTPPKKLNSSEYLATGKYPIVDQSQNFYCGWTNDNDALLNKNLPLIVFGDHTCILKLVDEPFVQGADGIKIIKPTNTLTTEFLYQHLNFNGVKQDGYKRHYSILKEKIVSYPNIKTGEQQKIAACLSSLDEVITAESQKLEVLKDHKKGLLQNLFPRLNYDLNDGMNTMIVAKKNHSPSENQKNHSADNVPKFRFKEFEKSGEWVEKKLGEVVVKVGSGVTPLGGEANYKKVGRPLVRSQNVSWGIFLLDNIAFIDEETHRNQISSEIQKEDVLLNITGASIGRSAVANEFVSGGNVNQNVCIIRVDKTHLNPYYLNQFLISDFGQKQIDSFQAGGNRQGLNFAQIRTFSIPIPTLQEQQKIASTLSSIDDLIIAQNQKLEALQLHKKGLLQGLFP